MKIAILTRTSATNFGTVLQAYALQRYIYEQGFYVKTVDDVLPRKVYNNIQTVKCKWTLKERIANIIDRWKSRKIYARAIKLGKTSRKFKKKYISYFYPKSLQDINQNFDGFIAGSDQIWAYSAEPKLFSYFLLESIEQDKKKISYAVSIGESEYPIQYKDKVVDLLSNFDYLSVREKGSKEIIAKYTNKAVEIVCDPVLLIDKIDWKRLAGKRKITKKYVFCYFLGNQDWYWEKLEVYARKNDCEVYVYQKEETAHPYRSIHVCSPKDFLNYIEFAEFILTDSFHGLCFSLLFEKQFCVLQRFLNDGRNTQNNRLVDLLSLIGLKDKFLSKESLLNDRIVDYESVNEKLEGFKETSKDYLKKVLGQGA